MNQINNAVVMPSLYDYFKNYTEEEVNLGLYHLSAGEIRLIHLKFGESLNNPVPEAYFDEDLNFQFNNELYPKLKRIIEQNLEKKFNKCEDIINISDVNFDNAFAKDILFESLKNPYLLQSLSKNELKILLLKSFTNYNNVNIAQIINEKEEYIKEKINCIITKSINNKKFTNELGIVINARKNTLMNESSKFNSEKAKNVIRLVLRNPNLLNSLSKNDLSILLLRAFRKLSNVDIAQYLNISSHYINEMSNLILAKANR